MSHQLETIHAQIQQLSLNERAELARRILETLEDEEAPPGELSADEIRRRVDDVRSGKDPCFPAEQVMAELEDELA
jgi:putative addiction module component (TIGR02574 family)